MLPDLEAEVGHSLVNEESKEMQELSESHGSQSLEQEK